MGAVQAAHCIGFPERIVPRKQGLSGFRARRVSEQAKQAITSLSASGKTKGRLGFFVHDVQERIGHFGRGFDGGKIGFVRNFRQL